MEWITCWISVALCVLVNHVSAQVKYTEVFPYWWTTPQGFNLTCPQGWSQRGPACLRVFPETLSWHDARKTCNNLKGQMVRVENLNKNIFVGSLAASLLQPESNYWIGLTREGSSGYDDVYWSDGSQTRTMVGRWGPGQPDDTSGSCTSASTNTAELHPWSLSPCYQRKPFVCQMEACLADETRCADGRCIVTSALCDGNNDCGDNSDENDCSSECRYHVTDSTNPIELQPYTNGQSCQWIIEGPVGKALILEFTNIETEEISDYIQIFTGGLTIKTSQYVGQISGQYSNVKYYSPNNLLIINFSSDLATPGAGFSATWEAADIIDDTLVAATVPATVASLGFPDAFPRNLQGRWLIESPKFWESVTISVENCTLSPGDSLIFYDGPEASDRVITVLKGSCPTKTLSIVSSSTSMLVRSQSTADTTGLFQLTYKSGCHYTIGGSYGEIRSPRYGYGTYPELMSCTWDINPDPLDKEYSVIFQDVDIGEGDSLTVAGANLSSTSVQTYPNGTTTKIQLVSDAVGAGQGFFAYFSLDCPEISPDLNKMTIFGSLAKHFQSNFTLYCKAGYFFLQEEYGQCSGSSVDESIGVEMICEKGGKWNRPRVPSCQEVSCGSPEAISNGYITNVTSAMYGGKTTYQCLPGFDMTGNATIDCLPSATWSSPPSCEANDCGPPPNVAAGNATYMTSSTTTYGSVVTYTCTTGYYLAGGVTIGYCQDDGTWSHAGDVPICQVMQCKVPEVVNGRSNPSSGSVVDYNETISVTCNQGYDTNNTEFSCLEDGSLTGSPQCEDIDECAAGSPCSGPATCQNVIGSFTCVCAAGYTLDTDNVTCVDVRECDVNNGYCDGSCTEEEPGYSCGCPGGTVLFDEDGRNGFSIPTEESGGEEWNILHLNHTCIAKTCPRLPHPFINGDVTVFNPSTKYHYVGDVVDVHCDVGYIYINNVTGFTNISLTCLDTGEWDRDIPECVALYCPPVNISGLENPPILSETNYVKFGDEVNMTCSPSDVRIRKCIYDVSSKSYRMEGENPECGVIKCQPPKGLTGVDNSTLPTSEKRVNATFTLACKAGFTLSGASQLTADSTVTCQENGQWDLGSIQCSGPVCTDPGRPPDGRQVSSNYEEGSEVTFTCDRPGYNPHPARITCIPSATVGQAVWSNTSSPQCIDEEDPVISGCPGNVTLFRYENIAEGYSRIGINLPNVTDNSGQVNVFLPNLNITDPVSSNVTLTWTAEDFSGNSAECSTAIIIKDVVYPIIDACPVSEYVFLTDENDTETISISPPLGARVVPDSVSVYSDMLYSTVDSIVVIEDETGNNASCDVQHFILPSPCSEWRLRTPQNGSKSCTRTGTGLECVLSCNSGYRFGINDTEVTYVCEDGEEFFSPAFGYLNTTSSPECTVPSEQVFTNLLTLLYSEKNGRSTESVNLTEFEIEFRNKLNELDQLWTDSCHVNVDPATPEIHISDNFPVSVTGQNIAVSLVIHITGNETEACSDIIYTAVGLTFPAMVRPIKDFKFDSSRWGLDDVTPQTDGMLCPYGTLNLDVISGLSGTGICVAAPAGYFVSTRTRVMNPCPRGSYTNNAGSWECIACPAGTNTFWAAATSQGDCVDECQPPMYSETGLPLCKPVPPGTYWTSPTNYTACPGNTTTLGSQGATNITGCISPCAPGWYSSTEYEPCLPCPIGYYQEQEGQLVCQECDQGYTTLQTGSNSSSDCSNNEVSFCDSVSCNNGGSCIIRGHTVLCDCGRNYTGSSCETMVNFCNSSPCYNNGTCQPIEGGFTCSCRTGFSGDVCEIEEDNCSTDPCENGGMCKDEIDDFTCFCPSTNPYSGKRCDQVVHPCVGHLCRNGASCRNISDFRYQCDCDAGFTGDFCETNINDCEPNPCMHGGNCTDAVAGFSCTCQDNYSGRLCENKLESLCQSENVNCKNGRCLDIFYTWGTQCVCQDGYQLVNDTCEEFDECTSDPCLNGATCTDMVNSYSCSCVAGYEGTQCQHEIDECSTSPCLHGRCTDLLNGYNCTCDPGFSGTNCEDEIDECKSNPCINGTCDDLINDYVCICQHGFSGRNCEVNIDECSSSPCFNNGSCIDEIAGYRCQCADGWEGDQCQNLTTSCTADTCDNGGVCYSLLQNYYCSCRGGYSGQNCSDGQAVCDVYNPCANGGSCITEQGRPSCSCPQGYTGDSCQCKINPCSSSQSCMNDGTCTIQADGGNTCICQTGFTGNRCETNFDNCAGVNCGNGICVDGLDEYFCKCQTGYSGPTCEIASNRNFDVDFGGFGHVELAVPHYINCSQFSLGFAFKHCPDYLYTGSIVTVEYKPHGSKSYIRFIDWNNNNITLHMPSQEQGETIPVFIDGFDNLPYSKDSWHYAALSIDMLNKDASIGFEDGSTVSTNWNMLPTDDILYGSFLVSVGGIGSNVYLGTISRVQTWCSLVQYNDPPAASAIDLLFSVDGDPNFTVDEDNLLSDWSAGEFKLHGPLSRMFPSDFYSGSCPTLPTPSAPQCQQRDYWRLVENGLIPVNIPQSYPISNHRSGSYFPIGVSEIYESELAEARPRNTCTFSVYGKVSECGNPGLPPNGTPDTCDTTPDIISERCNYTCNSGFAPVTHPPNFQTCVAMGIWDPMNPYDTFEFEQCGEATAAKKIVTFGWIYSASYLESWKDPWETFIESKLNDTSSLLGLCSLRNGCLVNVSGPTGIDATVDISVNIMLSPSMVGPSGRSLKVADAIVEAILLMDILHKITPNNSGMVTFEESSFWIDIKDACELLHAPVNGMCVKCTPGSYYNTSTLTCVPCEKGSYQDKSGQYICTMCGNDKTTIGTGSTDVQDCIDVCPSGSFYNTTSSACQDCPHGSYQEEEGQVFCSVCPPGTTTRFTGSANMSDCTDDCPNGYQIGVGGICDLCPLGTFRSVGISVLCQPCPPDRTTVEPGAFVQANCSRVLCPAGEYRLGDNPGECLPCPLGSYRNQSMDNCTLCGPFMRTEQNRSISHTDCKFYCPAGSYINNSTDPPTCAGCDRDFYKEESEFYATSCTPCPSNNPKTQGVNSTSVRDCRFGLCTAGQIIDPTNSSLCLNCSIGSYQSEPEPNLDHNCTLCPPGTTTIGETSIDSGDCKDFCPPGFELNQNGSCIPCQRGFYKDNNDVNIGVLALFSNCSACPTGYITKDTNSTSATDCSIEDCGPGYFTNENGTCEECPLNEYQDAKWQPSCKKCDDGFGTVNRKSNSSTLCLKTCPSGQYALNDQCQNCSRGYFKDNNVSSTARFNTQCQICPADYITETTGSLSASDCNTENCSAGEYLNSTGQCEPCPRDTYQPDKWMTSCIPCEGNNGTRNTGAKSSSECIEFCPSGKEVIDGNCTDCSRGYYKDNFETEASKFESCRLCPLDFITLSTGSASAADCNIGNCTAGQFINGTGQCELCPRGQYQPLPWMTNCSLCGDTQSTHSTGSTSVNYCVESCPSGKEYIDNKCQDCKRGFYKNNTESSAAEFSRCTMCDVDLITSGPGSTSVQDCNIGNCTSGYKLVGDLCEACPQGTYQDEKWQPNCKQCPRQSTTAMNASTSAEDCNLFPNRTWYMFRVAIVNVEWTADLGRPTSVVYGDLKIRTETIIGDLLSDKANVVYRSKIEILAFGKGSVLASFKVLADSTDADPVVVINEALQTVHGLPLTDSQRLYESITIQDRDTLVVKLPDYMCEGGTTYDLVKGQCVTCPDGLFQPPDVSDLCIPCPQGKVPQTTSGTETENCKSPCDMTYVDDRNNSQPYCLNGGVCEFVKDTETYRCKCTNSYDGARCQNYLTGEGNKLLYLAIALPLATTLILLVFFVVCVNRVFRGRKPIKEEKTEDDEKKTFPLSENGGAFYPNGAPGIDASAQAIDKQMPYSATYFDTTFKAPILPPGGANSMLSGAAGGAALSVISQPGYQPMGVQYPTYSTLGGMGSKYLFYEDRDIDDPEAVKASLVMSSKTPTGYLPRIQIDSIQEEQ